METKVEPGLIQLGLRENSFSRGRGGGTEGNLAVHLQQREGLDSEKGGGGSGGGSEGR